MRLIWNPKEFCFEAEFQDFQNDLDAVKAAGFKTTGPPDWKWFTFKIAVLEKLRKHRPLSGLTILEDALEHYKRLRKEEDVRAALLAELKQKKKHKPPEKLGDYAVPEGQEFGYNCVEDIEPTVRIGYIPPVWAGPNCHICNGRVDFYELQSPPTCLYCEKQLDNSEDLF